MKAKTYKKNDQIYCDPECPFLDLSKRNQNRIDNVFCTKLDKELHFYDWYLAICE